MLTPLRNMLRSPAAGGIFVIVIIAMAAWGVTDIFAGGAGSNLIKAGDRALSDRDLDATLERALREETDERGRALTKEEAMQRGILDQIFSDLSRATILTAYADEQGISATTDAIVETIRTNPSFQDTTGVFDPLRYSQLLNAYGYREADFETEVESGLTVTRIQSIPAAGLRVPAALARLQAAYSGELRSASWFIIEPSVLPPIEAPTEEELRSYYDVRKESLREPERRGISLIELSPDDFIAESDVSETDISSFYEAYKAERYTGPDSRTFTEFHFPSEAIARDALGRIAGGAAPEAIETATSTELRSGRREIIANARLAEPVFAPGTQIGTIHGPQPDGTSFVVIRLEDIIEGAVTPLDDVQAAISEELAREYAVGLFYDALPQFDDLLGTGADLEGIAEGLGTPVLSFAPVDTDGVTEDGKRFLPLVTAPGLLQMIYAQAEGRNTERFGDDETTWIARVDTIVPERLPEFEDVRDRLEADWRQQREREQLQTVAAEIEAAIDDGTTTLAAEAEKYDAVLDRLSVPVTRTNTGGKLGGASLSGLFAANEVGETFSIQGNSGQLVILQVDTIDRPASETLDILARSSALEIQSSIANDVWLAYLISISDNVEYDTNPRALDAYKRSLVTEQ